MFEIKNLNLCQIMEHRRGAFYFCQYAVPLLLKAYEQNSKYPPTVVFTGATAALKGSATFSSFATGKFAQRALAQSLAREFGPKGLHVAHAVIDGVIDIPATKDWLKDAGPDAKIDPQAVSGFLSFIMYSEELLILHDLDCRYILVSAYAAEISIHF